MGRERRGCGAKASFRATRAAAAAALAVIGAMALAGCTGLPAIPAPTHGSNAVSTPTPTATRFSQVTISGPAGAAQRKVDAVTAREAAVAKAVPAAGTVVATAHVGTSDGRVGFDVSVVATGSDAYDITTSNYHASSQAVQYNMFFRQYPEQIGSCVEEGVSFGYTNWGGPVNSDHVVPRSVDLQTAGDDPSFLENVVITTSPTDLTNTSCMWTVVAVTDLTWHAPNRHPGLTVTDSGPAAGARGTVTRTTGSTSSEPATYTIAPGDTLTGIEARFGLSTRDLVYLNARRAWADGFQIDSGQEVTLAPALR